MRNYELMIILSSQLDEEARGEFLSKVQDILKKKKGKVDGIDKWGKKKLAYPIKKQTDGFYSLINLTADSAAVKELDRVLSISDEVIRFSIFKKDVRVA